MSYSKPSMNDSGRDSKLAALFGSIESRVVGFYEFVFASFLKSLFPFGTPALGVTLRIVLYMALSIPFLVGALIVASFLTIGSSATMASLVASKTVLGEWLTLIKSDAHLFAVAFAVWYLISIFTYTHSDRNNYEGSGRPEQFSAQWMYLKTALLQTPFVSGYVLLGLFGGQTGWTVFGFCGIITLGLMLRWRDSLKELTMPDYFTGRSAEGTSDYFSKQMNYFWGILALEVIALAIAVQFFGLDAVFGIHLMMMVLVARRLRWLTYEDKLGFKETNPNTRLWAFAARTPLMFALIGTLYTGAITSSAVVASFAPLLVGVGYLANRKWTLGGRMMASIYDDYEQMTELGSKRQKMSTFLASRGQSLESAQEEFARNVSLYNQSLKYLQNHLRDDFGRRQSPTVGLASTSLDGFDVESEREKLAEIEAFLNGATSATDADTKLQAAREELDDVQDSYEKARKLN